MHLDIVYKAFVGVLAAVIIIGSGLGVTTGFSQSVAANNYMETVSKVIVESNYSENVIEQLIEEANGNGYGFEVTVLGATKAGVKSYAKVTLTYYLEIPLFGIRQQKIRSKLI